MGLRYRDTDSGLVLAEYGADGAAVRAALKRHDPQLVLLPPGVDANDGANRQHWRVYAQVGGGRLVHVLSWIDDDGNPLPLTMGIVDEVQRHDRNMRGNASLVSADEHNARFKAEQRKDYRRDADALVDEYRSRLDRGGVQVAATGKQKQGYLRNKHLPANMRPVD